MKKLLISEAIAVAASVAIVIAGSIMKWPNETIVATVGVFAAVIAAAIVFAVASAEYPVAGISFTMGAVASVAAVAAGFVGALTVPFLIVVIGLTGGFSIIAAIEFEIRYSRVFLSLLGEGTIIGAILYYGPDMIRGAM